MRQYPLFHFQPTTYPITHLKPPRSPKTPKLPISPPPPLPSNSPQTPPSSSFSPSRGCNILASLLFFPINPTHPFTTLNPFLTTSTGKITGHSTITTTHQPTTSALSLRVPSESRYHSGIHRPALPRPLMHRMQITPNSSHPAIETGISTRTIARGSYGVPSLWKPSSGWKPPSSVLHGYGYGFIVVLVAVDDDDDDDDDAAAAALDGGDAVMVLSRLNRWLCGLVLFELCLLLLRMANFAVEESIL
ncbi:hypothetical protein MKX07_007194 [Trichoderma sp. CBMAI-0711]|nr:hypothetical protein MKX07_007194 [Trichoderma sp. CBMAI-0711]